MAQFGKLFVLRACPHGQVCRITAELCSAELKLEIVPSAGTSTLLTLDIQSGRFKATNPLNRTPCLVLDNGKVINDTFAICNYFIRRSGNKQLLGEGV